MSLLPVLSSRKWLRLKQAYIKLYDSSKSDMYNLLKKRYPFSFTEIGCMVCQVIHSDCIVCRLRVNFKCCNETQEIFRFNYLGKKTLKIDLFELKLFSLYTLYYSIRRIWRTNSTHSKLNFLLVNTIRLGVNWKYHVDEPWKFQ